MLDITDSLHNITTLTLCKRSVGIKNISFLAAFIKTGVVLSLWDQDKVLSKAEVIKSLSASRNITTIKLLNVSGKRLTVEEEDIIATIIRENTQLENVLLGSQSRKSVVDDFYIFNRAHNIDCEVTHHKAVSTSNINKIDEPIPLSQELIFKIISVIKCYANLKILDLSSIVIAKELAEQLAILLVNCTKLEKLILEGCFLGNDGVNVISNSLKNITTLKHLDLSNNNITEYAQIAIILEATTGLERLYLEKNHLPTTAADKLSVAIANSKYLKVLNVDRSIICSSMITAFSTAVDKRLLIYIHDHQSIEVMDIRGPLSSINTLTMCRFPIDKLGDTSIIAKVFETGTILLIWTHPDILSTAKLLTFFSNSKQITTIKLLNVSGREFTESEVDTIATVISENVLLENVWLGTHSVKTIADDFRTYIMSKDKIPNHTEQSASSSKDNTTNNEFPHLFPNNLLFKILCALQNITELRTLDLSSNVIIEELAEQLAIVLTNSTKLEVLLLEDCSLGNEGVNVIANSLSNITTLKHLDLSNNNITEEVVIVNILKSNTKLKELYLRKNCLQLSAGDSMSLGIVKLKSLEVLSIDQNIISRLANAFSAITKLFIYNHDYQTTEVIEIRGSFNNINALILCKIPTVSEVQPMITFILENGSAMLWWSQCNVLSTTGVLRFLSSFKKITTIKLLNNSGSELTEPEVDTIATVMSENVQLENMWLGSQSMKVINDDFVVLAHEMPEVEKHNQFMQLMSNSSDGLSANELKSNKEELQSQFRHFVSVLKDDHSVNQHRECAPFEPDLNVFHKLLPSILSALRCITDLKTLDLSGNVITEELAKQLVIVLANSTKLEKLLLRDCSLGNEGVNVIANSLNNVTTLKYLDLSNNNITEEVAIVNIFKNTTNLKELHFHKNCLPFSAEDNMSAAIVNLKNLEELSIDQNIISRNMALQLANTFTTSAKLFIYNHDHQTTEMIEISGSFNNINTLTLCKIPTVNKDQPMITFVLENRSAMLWWSQYNVLKNTTGVLRFLNSFKKITTIKLLNNSGSKLTEPEVDAIATVISENVQLQNVWLGSQSITVINDDFVVLAHEMPEVEKHNQFMQLMSNSRDGQSATNELKSNKE